MSIAEKILDKLTVSSGDLPEDMKLNVNRGSNGRWRWALYEGGVFVASGHPRGWETEEAARDDFTNLARRLRQPC